MSLWVRMWPFGFPSPEPGGTAYGRGEDAQSVKVKRRRLGRGTEDTLGILCRKIFNEGNYM